MFAMSEAEVSKPDNLIQGTCFIAGRCLKVLFDSRVTHFFVSRLYVDELGRQSESYTLNFWFLH